MALKNMADNLVIKRVTRPGKNALKDLNVLLLQLSSRGYQMTLPQLTSVINNKNTYIIALYDKNNIVGTATLIIIFQLTGFKGYIEDVVVDEKYRGRGFGKKLMMHIIALAKKLNVDSLELKSELYRVVANMLYKKLGFTIKEANVYCMKFEKNIRPTAQRFP